MTDIVDLNLERNKRDQPDPEFRQVDDFGRPMGRFGFEYEMDGKTWGFDLWAYDAEDAARRAKAMSSGVTCIGQLYSVRPA